jgi:3-dehydroquinate synthase
MRPLTINIQLPQAAAPAYNIKIGSGLLISAGKWARACLGRETRRILIVSNPTVFGHYGDRVRTSIDAAGFQVSTFLMKDGEHHKNMRSLDVCLATLSENGITRTDAIVALGGGVVGDLAGFAAALHLRGIKFLQIPTTLLAMVDSSVGGKTGVNSLAGKNLVGAFHQPSGVLIDVDVLDTLPEREMTAGLCEMIKHAALSGRELLKATSKFLNIDPSERTLVPSAISDLIRKNVEFKARIVSGDERESASKRDPRSRKILNFGHTLAHALEKVTEYKYLRHGEAVGYGILFAAELSKSLALLDGKDVKLLNDVVHRAGPVPTLANIDITQVREAFRFDKKHASDSLQFVLLKAIGKPVIVSSVDIPSSKIIKALQTVLR